MQNLLSELENLLKNDERYFTEKGLLKNKLTEMVLKSDKKLLKTLLNNNDIKEHFFAKIDIGEDKALIFDKDKFISFINNKDFLPNSYTSFARKIGLISNNKSIVKESDDVSLVWPYKECVLEGGQEKENQKRNEIFYNEDLAPDEIDRLFEPKVLTNFKYIDKNGEHKINDNQFKNLLIKGNNLLALHCLKKKFMAKIKLIYIDPPYNTGDDNFEYNDKFNHSTWLTFMKNRLTVARDLLRKDGSIFVQIDYHEVGYLKVLMDEIFCKNENNFVQLISVKTSSPAGFKTINPGPIDVTEYTLFYVKSRKHFNFKKLYVPVDYDDNYDHFIKNINDPPIKWEIVPLRNIIYKKNEITIGNTPQESAKNAKEKWGTYWKTIRRELMADFALKNPNSVISIRDPHKPTKKLKKLLKESKNNRNKIFIYKKENYKEEGYVINGGAMAFYSNKVREIDGMWTATELLTDLWTDISWDGIAKEGGVKLKNGKKPEKLIKRIIELGTDIDDQNDIILDFFAGSGTTPSVAHKMNKKYIGIEQIDYGKNDSFNRIKNVINADQSGISRMVNWQGGGSFIYMELKQWNEKYIKLIETADSSDILLGIYEKMGEEAFFRYDVDFSKFNTDKLSALSLKDQKSILCECLDKNHLYVNLSEIEDTTYNVSDEDKKLNKLFYNQDI